MMVASPTRVGAADELQVIRTSNVRDVAGPLLGATGAWRTGDNTFVLEFDPAPHKRLIDVGAPPLTAALPAAGDRPLRVAAHLQRGNVPGRYVGMIRLPRAGEWSVTVTWSGGASNGRQRFRSLREPGRKERGDEAFLDEIKANGVKLVTSNGEAKDLVASGELAWAFTPTPTTRAKPSSVYVDRD